MFKKSGLSDVIILHYEDVRAVTAGAITMNSIQGKYSYHLNASRDDCRKIVTYLQHRDAPGKINDNFIRLHIPRDPEWAEYFMDQEGRVFDGSSEYILNPYRYLKVVDYMDYLKTKNNIKEGGWNNRKQP